MDALVDKVEDFISMEILHVEEPQVSSCPTCSKWQTLGTKTT